MSKKSGGPGLPFISFWLLVVTVCLYLVAMILHFVGINATIVDVLKQIAFAFMVCVVAVLAWRHVSGKQVVWKVLYFIVLAITLVCIVLPLAL